MPFIDGVSSGTSNKANVDSLYNLQINTPMTGSAAGFVTTTFQTDAGIVMGTPSYQIPDISINKKIRTGIDTPMWSDRFTSGNVSTTLYNQTLLNMTVNQSGQSGFISINDNLASGNGNYAFLISYKQFQIFPSYGLKFTCYGKVSSTGATNNSLNIGIGNPQGGFNPMDGAYFQISGNTISAIRSYNSVLTHSGINIGLIPTGVTHKFEIDTQVNAMNFYIDNNLVANMLPGTGVGLGSTMSASNSAMPFVVMYNWGNVPSPSQNFKMSEWSVSMLDANITRSWPTTMAGMGAVASQGQSGQLVTGTTAQYANNSSGLSFQASNTVSVLGTGLGGQFIFSGTVGSNSSTDYIICSYPVPTGSTTIPGKTLYIHGINIQTTNLSSYIQAVPMVMCAAYGHTNESLATSESATTKAPRFLPLGTLNVPSGSSAFYTPAPLTFPFTAPIVVNAGENFAITAKLPGMPNSLAINQEFYIGIDGYWE